MHESEKDTTFQNRAFKTKECSDLCYHIFCVYFKMLDFLDSSENYALLAIVTLSTGHNEWQMTNTVTSIKNVAFTIFY